MLQIGILVAVAAALFWWLPIGASVIGGIFILFLLAAKLRKAVRRGRRALIARDDDAHDEARCLRDRDATFLYAMWIGLTISGGAHADGGGYMGHHGDGGYGGDMGGGFDGGGGDGGM